MYRRCQQFSPCFFHTGNPPSEEVNIPVSLVQMLVVAKCARHTDDRILHGTLHGTPRIQIVVCLVQLNCSKKQKERVSLTDQKNTSKT